MQVANYSINQLTIDGAFFSMSLVVDFVGQFYLNANANSKLIRVTRCVGSYFGVLVTFQLGAPFDPCFL